MSSQLMAEQTNLDRLVRYCQCLVGDQHAADDIATTLRQDSMMAAAAQSLAEAHLGLADWDAAAQYAAQVVQLEDADALPDGLRALGEARAGKGEFEVAEQLFQQSIKAAQQIGDTYLEAYARRAMGRLLKVTQKSERARQAFEQAIALFDGLNLVQESSRTQREWRD